MTNMMNSDFYRLKKGKTLWTVMVVTIAIVLLIWVLSSSSASIAQSLPTDGMTDAEISELYSDSMKVEQEMNQTIGTAPSFILEIMGQNYLFFLFLPIILAVFCADFDFETYKNTLSYESNRARIYLSRLFLVMGLCFAVKVISLITAGVVGVIFIGTAGFTPGLFITLLYSFLLQIPIYLAVISFTFLMITFFKKNGATIATYILGLMVVSMLMQVIPSYKPGLDFFTLLDPTNAISLVVDPSSLTTGNLLIIVIFYSLFAILSILLGMLHFKKQDLN